MPRHAKTVSGALVRALSQVAARGGIGRERFLGETGLADADLSRPDARVAAERYQRALSLAEQAGGPEPGRPEVLTCLEEGLPLLVGSWLNAPTLASALDSFRAFLPIFSETDHVQVVAGGDRARVAYQTDLPVPHAAFAALGCFLPLVHVVRSYQPGRAARFSLELTEGPRCPGSAVEEALGCRILTGPRCVLEVSGIDLHARHPAYNPALAALITRSLEGAVAELEREPSVSQVVERILAGALASSTVAEAWAASIERACAELRMSRGTLKRRLAAEGTCFKALHARACVREAIRLLEDSDLPVHDVAGRLGFSSRTSFDHFFRRVTGRTPSQWRHPSSAPAGGRS